MSYNLWPQCMLTHAKAVSMFATFYARTTVNMARLSTEPSLTFPRVLRRRSLRSSWRSSTKTVSLNFARHRFNRFPSAKDTAWGRCGPSIRWQSNLVSPRHWVRPGKDGIRYILRRNPVRAEKCAASRRDKLHTLERFIEKKNNYLQEHPRSHIKVATRHANELCEKLRIKEWVEIMIEGREIHLRIDEVAKTKAARLDGCYVIKTDLAVEMCSTQTVHDRYKDLTHVECAFRTSKTVELQMRPIHVCLAPRTRADALVVMLAYRIAKELSRRWVTTNMKIQEGIDVLSMLCVNDVQTGGQTACALVPQPSAQSRELLDLAGIVLPASLPRRKIHVATRRKLHKRRKRN